MTLLTEQKFVCLDCETTGLEVNKDRIIEIAVIKFDIQTSYERMETLINPEYPISETSITIHHITQEMVSGSPTIKEVLQSYLSFIGKNIIVGHGIGFDIDIIHETAKREGIPCKIKENLSIDTLRLARLYGESPTNSLEKLREHFHIDAEIAHRAMGDVLVNVEVFKRLVKSFKTTDKIFDVLSRPILLKEMPLGKHKGRSFREIPLEYLLWAVNKNFDQDLIFSIKTELKRRKTGNSFSQSSNPFQNLS